MGTVYLAIRDDEQFRKHVAIKLMLGSVDDREHFLRFRSERQILASLDHPNIARLIDGGTTDKGDPYVVMEYVEGQPIDRYCDRLGLFLTVCDAGSAEPLILHGHEVLSDKYDPGHRRLELARQGLIELYEAWGRPDRASAYR